MDSLAIKTPLGGLTLFADERSVTVLEWGRGRRAPARTRNAILESAADVLLRHFESGAEDFSALPLVPAGTAFQRRVWREMRMIKPGRTMSYGEIARRLQSSPRAVGTACGANPIPILVPCHRVVGSAGRIGGYTAPGGIETKRALLRLEGALC